MRNPRLRILSAVFAAASASIAVLAYGLGHPRSTLLAPATVRSADPREVMLTFDDGPSVPYTGQILDVLRANGIKATFFLCGRNAKRYPDLVRRIHDEEGAAFAVIETRTAMIVQSGIRSSITGS